MGATHSLQPAASRPPATASPGADGSADDEEERMASTDGEVDNDEDAGGMASMAADREDGLLGNIRIRKKKRLGTLHFRMPDKLD